jgi:Uma2 family endonuclease
MSVQITRQRFSVDNFEQMVRVGILAEDDRVELIDGEVIQMAPIGGRHADCVNLLADLLIVAARRSAIVSIQNPVRLGEHSEPQPDLALLQRRRGFHTGRTPTSDEVLLVIEVADTTLDYDQEVKLPLYASAGIPEVWLIDVNEEIITVWREPRAGLYSSGQTLRAGSDVSPVLLPSVSLRVADIFGPDNPS